MTVPGIESINAAVASARGRKKPQRAMLPAAIIVALGIGTVIVAVVVSGALEAPRESVTTSRTV
ncbi:hypothetical protein D3C83_207430 [compost metagenome]